MAYVNVKDWTVDQVTDWLKGLDNVILPYTTSFLNNMVTGHQLLNLRADDLEHLGVKMLGHQEIILEAVELLRNFHFELDKENLQMLALRLSCAANSLYKELLLVNDDCSMVHTQVMADVHNIITTIKPLVCWLDRSPFVGDKEYVEKKSKLFKLGVEIATCARRGIFSETPVRTIKEKCEEIARIADYIIQEISDPMILQPASLDLATLKKKEQEWGFDILQCNQGVHQITDITFGTPAHGSSKIEEGDEIVQVNYQTVVGWQSNKVMSLLKESPPEIVLTLKKRPRHTKVYGQIYMKPYRLPSKKRDGHSWSRWKDNLPSPGLLDLPPITIPKLPSVTEPQSIEIESSSDSEPPDSPDGSIRVYPLKPRPILQRRNTITGATPTSKRPIISIDQYWDLLQSRTTSTHSSSYNIDRTKFEEESNFLRDKSASCNTGLDLSQRPTTIIGISQSHNRKTPSFKKNFGDKPLTKKRVNFEETTENVPIKKPDNNNCNLDDSKSVSVNSLVSLTNENISFIDEGRELTDRTSMSSTDWQKPENQIKDPTLADVNIHNIIKNFESPKTTIKPKILPRSQCKKVPPPTPPEVPLKPESIIKKPIVPPRSASTKIRGKLDKSHSTPAYDLTGDEKFIQKVEKLPDLIPESIIPYELGIPITEQPENIIEDVPPKPPPRTFGIEIPKPAYPADSPKPTNLLLLRNEAAEKTKPIFEFPEVKEEVVPKFFEPKMVSTPIVKAKMDFDNVDNLYNKVAPTYEVQKGLNDSKVSPTNSIVKGLMSGKNKGGKKKHSLISKRRRVTVSDLSPADIQGFLYQRLRGKHNQNVHWEKRWFVLLGNCLYGFKTKEDYRAACLIFLSGFTVAVASEVKSRSNAFKVYHTGTVFYFSADDSDALQSWIELIKSATLHNDPSRNPDSSLYSETDESDTEKPKPILAEKSDSFNKKFGSLKKFSSSKSKDPAVSGSTSLDRKWFFPKSSGASKNSVPVPTAQFRSYRKMRTTDVSTSVTTGNFTSHVPLFTPNLSQSQNVSVPNLTVDTLSKPPDKVNSKMKTYNYVHASNPSLCNVNEFNTNFTKKTKQRNENLAGFVTLEELMNRQTEERKMNPHHIVEEMANNLKLIKPDVVYGEVPIRPKDPTVDDKLESAHNNPIKISHSRSSSGSQKSSDKHDTSSSCFGKRLGSLKKSHKEDEFEGRTSTYPKTTKGFDQKLNRSLPRTHKLQQEHYRHDDFTLPHYSSDKNLSQNFKERSYEMIHCQETVNDVHFAQNRPLDDRMYQDTPKKSHKIKKQHSFSEKKSSKIDSSVKFGGNKIGDSSMSKMKLKSAVHYMPVTLPDGKSKPKYAFELNLDDKLATKSGGKMKQIFGKQTEGKKEKTFLGSPKLRKAFFKSSSTNNDINWVSNVSQQNTSNIVVETNNSSQVPTESFSINISPPVDYPDMEYPPVFEPETYSLADPQSSLSILRKQSSRNHP